MNWYNFIKISNNLGLNFGKWLVLFHYNQFNETNFINDLTNYLYSNPTSIDFNSIRNSAINYFTTQLKIEPNVNEIQVLDNWLSYINGHLEQTNNQDFTAENLDQSILNMPEIAPII